MFAQPVVVNIDRTVEVENESKEPSITKMGVTA
jgi:hypothetical protein